MATSDDAHHGSDIGGKAEPGTALTAAAETGVGPFIAAAEAASAAPRGLRARLLDYSAHVAIIVGLLGFAWTVSNHLGTKPTAAQIETPVKTVAAAPRPPAATPVTPKPIDQLAELRQANAQMASDIKALRANLDSLRTAARQDRTPAEVRALEADLETVKSGLHSTRSETDQAIAQLSGKVDKLQAAPAPSKMQQMVDRIGHLEHQSTDTTSTGSIGAGATTVAKAAPIPPIKPNATKFVSAEEAKPQVLAGWVVRDVYDGVALIEGKHGPMEVVPGVSVPGAGVVKSIERHGSGWTVTTSKGLLAYAAPPRDYRRAGPRGFYQDYPSDY